jgi:hypothetical protein
MDFVSYVDEVVKEYKRMRILDLADPKYIDDIYKIVKTNCSYFMKEEEKLVKFKKDLEHVNQSTTFQWIKNFFMDLKKMTTVI